MKDVRIADRTVDQLVRRLNTLTMVLKSCRGRSCVEPWRELHPSGDVEGLLDSLNERFDDFIRNSPGFRSRTAS